MWKRWQHNRQTRRLARELSKARRGADGLYLEEWPLSSMTQQTDVDAILSWCREVVARCRRPFGIDHFDLALALGHVGQPSPISRLYRLRPADLYDQSVADHLSAFLSGQMAPQPTHVAVALFSWGDATHRALPSGSGD